MNQVTTEKLRKNPHYKMGAQQEGSKPFKRKPMIEFGQINRHNPTVPLHDVAMGRFARTHN